MNIVKIIPCFSLQFLQASLRADSYDDTVAAMRQSNIEQVKIHANSVTFSDKEKDSLLIITKKIVFIARNQCVVFGNIKRKT